MRKLNLLIIIVSWFSSSIYANEFQTVQCQNQSGVMIHDVVVGNILKFALLSNTYFLQTDDNGYLFESVNDNDRIMLEHLLINVNNGNSLDLCIVDSYVYSFALSSKSEIGNVIETPNYIYIIKPDAKFMDDGRVVSTPGDGIPSGVQDDVLRIYTEANSTLPTYGQMNSLPLYMSVNHWNPLLCEMLDFDYNGYTDWKAVPNHYIDELKEKLNTVDSSDFPEELIVVNANSSRPFKSANKANAYQTPIELTTGTIGGQSIICYTPK